MSNYEKQNFVSGQILKAEHLNHMEAGIEAVANETNGCFFNDDSELTLTASDGERYTVKVDDYGSLGVSGKNGTSHTVRYFNIIDGTAWGVGFQFYGNYEILDLALRGFGSGRPFVVRTVMELDDTATIYYLNGDKLFREQNDNGEYIVHKHRLIFGNNVSDLCVDILAHKITEWVD